MPSINSSVLFTITGTQGLRYISTWDASVGTFPGGGSAQGGDLYKVSVAGTVGGVAFDVGDSLIASTANASTTTFASNWTKVDDTESVNTVFGRTGNVIATEADYALGQLSDVDTTTVAPVNSHILRFNGTSWGPGVEGSFGLFADNTTVAPAAPGAPTTAEIATFVGLQRDKFVFYTGTNNAADPYMYVWYVDRAGSVISLRSPSSSFVETLPASIVDAKGDLIVGSAADTVIRLPVGANGLGLKANSAQPSGLEWVADTVEVVSSAGALSGAAPAGAKWGINTLTGDAYYVSGGNWTPVPVVAVDLNTSVSNQSSTPYGLAGPVAAPSGQENGDLHIEIYSDVTAYFTAAGGTWPSVADFTVPRDLTTFANAVTAANDATGSGGSATTAARSDHKHIAQSPSASANNLIVPGSDGLHYLPMNPAAFSGNLAPTDNTLQKVADKFDQYTVPPGIVDWATATAYAVGDYVNQGNKLYKVLVAHTSGVFNTDLTANRLVEVSTADTNWIIATNNIQTVDDGAYVVSPGLTVLMPVAPIAGQSVRFAPAGDWATLGVTFTAAGATTVGAGQTMPTSGDVCEFIYDAVANNWIAFLGGSGSPTKAVPVNALAAPVLVTLPAATGSGSIKFYSLADKTNTATLAVASGEQLNGVTNGTFLFSAYNVGSQFIATDRATGKWDVTLIGPTTTVTKAFVLADGAGSIVTNGTTQVLTNYVERTDTTSSFNPTTGVFTAPRAGLYRVTMGGYWDFGAGATADSNDRLLTIAKNGSTVTSSNIERPASGLSWQPTVQIIGMVTAAQGDTIDVRVSGSAGSGGAITFFPNAAFGGQLQIEEITTTTVLDPTAVTVNDQTASGYFDIGGTRIQWSSSSVPPSGSTSLVAPFANTSYVVTATVTATAGYVETMRITGKTTTSFVATSTFYNGAFGNNTGQTFDWFAVGRKP